MPSRPAYVPASESRKHIASITITPVHVAELVRLTHEHEPWRPRTA